MNSILSGIYKVKSKLMTSIDYQSEALNILSGVVDQISDCNYTIADGYGGALDFSVQSGQINIYKADYANEVARSLIYSGTVTDYATDLEKLISNEVNDLTTEFVESGIQNSIIECGRGMHTNQLLTVLLDKYTTNSRSKATDLVSIINSYDISALDKSQLIQAVSSASDEEGLVSNIQFMGIIQGLLTASQEQLEDGKITMDETKIFYISNFLASAWNSILSSIISLISILLTAVNTLLGFIVGAIGWIVSTVFDAISQVATSKISVINPLSSTNWFEGPNWAKTLTTNYSDISFKMGSDVSVSSNSVNIFSQGVFDDCVWLGENNQLYVNRFMCPNLHLGRAATWLFDLMDVEAQADSSLSSTLKVTFSVNPLSVSTTNNYQFPSSCYMSESELEEFMSKSASEQSDYLAQCYYFWSGLVALYAVYKSNTNLIVRIPAAWASDGTGYIFQSLKEALSDGCIPAYRVLCFIYGYRTSGGYGQYIPDYTDSALTNIALDEVKASDHFSNYFDLQSDSLNWTGDDYNASIHFDYPVIADPISMIFYPRLEDVYRLHQRVESEIILSSLPTDRRFKYASYSTESALGAAVIVSTIAATVLIAGTLAINAIRKKMWKNQLDRKRNLLNLTDQYLDNPTDSNFNNLYKAQRSYNFKARIFGWDTYDASNQWFNSAGDGSSTNTNVDLSRIEKLIH